LPHYLLCRPERLAEPSIAAFRGWILAEAEKTRCAMDAFAEGFTVVRIDVLGKRL
jgi:hypothetical protein